MDSMMKASAMAITACRIIVKEHDQTYDGEPMGMEEYKAITLAQRAVEMVDRLEGKDDEH